MTIEVIRPWSPQPGLDPRRDRVHRWNVVRRAGTRHQAVAARRIAAQRGLIESPRDLDEPAHRRRVVLLAGTTRRHRGVVRRPGAAACGYDAGRALRILVRLAHRDAALFALRIDRRASRAGVAPAEVVGPVRAR